MPVGNVSVVPALISNTTAVISDLTFPEGAKITIRIHPRSFQDSVGHLFIGQPLRAYEFTAWSRSYAYSNMWNAPLLCIGGLCSLDDSQGYFDTERCQEREASGLVPPAEPSIDFVVYQLNGKICVLSQDSAAHSVVQEVAGSFTSAASETLYARHCTGSVLLHTGRTHVFNLNDRSMNIHPFALSDTRDGTHAGGAIYHSGVEYRLDGGITAWNYYGRLFGSAVTREVRIVPSQSTTMYYFSLNKRGVGGEIHVQASINIASPTDAYVA